MRQRDYLQKRLLISMKVKSNLEVLCTHQNYTKKAAVGIEVNTKEGRTEGMGRINPKQHMWKEK
jgi:hypothetical protein